MFPVHQTPFKIKHVVADMMYLFVAIFQKKKRKEKKTPLRVLRKIVVTKVMEKLQCKSSHIFVQTKEKQITTTATTKKALMYCLKTQSLIYCLNRGVLVFKSLHIMRVLTNRRTASEILSVNHVSPR